MKMKLPDLEGKVITIKSDQKEAHRRYENSLKTKRGVFMVTTRAPHSGEVAQPEINRAGTAQERRLEPVGGAGERKFEEWVSKHDDALDQTAQDRIAKVRPIHQWVKERHLVDLEELFTTIAKSILNLNPGKCVFRIEAGKFLGL